MSAGRRGRELPRLVVMVDAPDGARVPVPYELVRAEALRLQRAGEDAPARAALARLGRRIAPEHWPN